jgi:hypothetical protein
VLGRSATEKKRKEKKRKEKKRKEKKRKEKKRKEKKRRYIYIYTYLSFNNTQRGAQMFLETKLSCSQQCDDFLQSTSFLGWPLNAC